MANARRNVDDEMLGSDEPEIFGVITDPNDMRLKKAYNYYAYYHDSKPTGKKIWSPRSWISQYLESKGKSKEFIEAFNKVPDMRIFPVHCAIARLTNNGTILPREVMDRFHAKIISWVNEVREPEVIFEKAIPKKTVQDHILSNASDMIGEIEETLDGMISTKKIPDFKMYSYLTSKGASSRIAKIIGEHFKPLHNDLVEAYEGGEAKEGYSHLTKAQLKAHVEFFADLVDDCFKFGENKITSRKPRKKKVKSASVIIKSLKYQKEDVNLKIVSVDPAKIVGAQSLITYNTKTSTITAYYANDNVGLSVKGTTVQGFNPTTSITKRAGRSTNVLPDIVSGGKVTLRRALDAIKAKPTEATGRINQDTILLRIA